MMAVIPPFGKLAAVFTNFIICSIKKLHKKDFLKLWEEPLSTNYCLENGSDVNEHHRMAEEICVLHPDAGT